MVLSDYLFDIWIGFPRRFDQEERFVCPLDVILPPVDCFHLRQHLNACCQAALDQQVRQPLAILLSLCRSQHDQSVSPALPNSSLAQPSQVIPSQVIWILRRRRAAVTCA